MQVGEWTTTGSRLRAAPTFDVPLERRNPALHGTPGNARQLGGLPAALAARDQRQKNAPATSANFEVSTKSPQLDAQSNRRPAKSSREVRLRDISASCCQHAVGGFSLVSGRLAFCSVNVREALVGFLVEYNSHVADSG